MKRESPAAAARSSGQSWRPAARVKVNHYAATSAAIMLLCRSDLVSRHQAALPARNSIRFRGRPTPAATWSGQSKAGSNLYNWPQLAAQSQSERPQPRRPVGVQRAATADLPSNCLAGSNLTRNSICSNPKSGRLLAGARNHPRQVRPRAPDAGRDLQEAERRVAQGKVSWTRVVAGQLGGPQTGERSAHSIVRSPPPAQTEMCRQVAVSKQFVSNMGTLPAASGGELAAARRHFAQLQPKHWKRTHRARFPQEDPVEEDLRAQGQDRGHSGEVERAPAQG